MAYQVPRALDRRARTVPDGDGAVAEPLRHGVARDERHPEAGGDRLLHGAVRAEDHGRWVDAELSQELVARLPRSRPLLPEQPGLLSEQPRRHRRVSRVPRRAGEDEGVGGDGKNAGAEAGGRAAGDDEVRLVVGERLPDGRAVADLDPHARLGALPAEGGDERQEEPLGRRRDGRQAHRAAHGRLDAGGRAGSPLEQAERLAGRGGEDEAGFGEAQATAVPHDELDAELPLEGPDGGRHRGLRDDEPLGRSPDGPGVGYGKKRPQLAERHAPSIS